MKVKSCFLKKHEKCKMSHSLRKCRKKLFLDCMVAWFSTKVETVWKNLIEKLTRWKCFFRRLTRFINFISKSGTHEKLYFRVGHVVNILFQKVTRCRRVLPKSDMCCFFSIQNLRRPKIFITVSETTKEINS